MTNNVKLTQRDMLMRVYTAVVGNGEDGLIHDVKQIRSDMMTRGDCSAIREAENRGKDRRFDKARGILGFLLPSLSLVAVIVIAVVK